MCQSKNRGEKLKNGLFMELLPADEIPNTVWGIYIRQNKCFTNNSEGLAFFSLEDPKEEISTTDILKYETPYLYTDQFIKTQQYKDIKAFAESIHFDDSK